MIITNIAIIVNADIVIIIWFTFYARYRYCAIETLSKAQRTQSQVLRTLTLIVCFNPIKSLCSNFSFIIT